MLPETIILYFNVALDEFFEHHFSCYLPHLWFKYAFIVYTVVFFDVTANNGPLVRYWNGSCYQSTV